MTQCAALLPEQACELAAAGKVDIHGCHQQDLCVPCWHHLQLIWEQAFGQGVDMECHLCNSKYSLADWGEFTLYEREGEVGAAQ
jgi:hypothetical protein